MSDIVIKAENLGKSYTIGHKSGNDPFPTLRDVMMQRARLLWQKSKDLAQGKALVTGNTLEEIWALQDVDFEIHRGEVVGVIGRNGAGKSTLLKVLTRITEPSAGRVTIKGRVACLLEVGTGFHPELTGRENIFLNGAILGMTQHEIKGKFDEIVAFSEIDRFLDTPVKRYSSGMYVRLAFAVAAHLEPEILLVDEVLAVGDAAFQKKCLGKMGDVAKEGRTVLFVSHNMAAIKVLCGRGVVLTNGRISFEGSANAAIQAYTEQYFPVAHRTWVRAEAKPTPPIMFERLSAQLVGEQPQLRLVCDIQIRCLQPCAASFIAVDICDSSFTPIMQALPEPGPHLNGIIGLHRLELEIDLPPLIPGLYGLDFWIGSHYNTTLDYVRNAIGFEVTNSPSKERSFPHSSDHGFLVPMCRYTPCNDHLIKRRGIG